MKMFSNSFLIRGKSHKPPEEEEISDDDDDEPIEEEGKKRIGEKHAYVFFLIGMSTYPNTDTSLLTQKLFRCENFVNDCMVSHNILLALLSLTFTLVISLDIKDLVCTVWASFLLHLSHVLIAIFGNGIHARNLFILVFALLGILRASLVFSSSTVIPKYFYLTAFVLLNNSRSAFSLVSGLIQGTLNNIIGYETILDARYNLILCHSFQALITLLGALWITYIFFIYIDYEDNVGNDGWGKSIINKIWEIPKKLDNIKHYYTKFILFHMVSIKYFFHTGLIPFLLDLPVTSKLKGSVMYTLFEFLGRTFGTLSDETIYDKQGLDEDHVFFITKDLPLFGVIFCVIGLNSLILYSTTNGKFRIPITGFSLITSMAFSGFFYGYIATRATRGSKAILDYKKTKNKTKNGVYYDTIPEDTTKLVTEVQTMTYYCSLFIPFFFSRIAQLYFSISKSTRDYILNRRSGNLNSKDVSALISFFRRK